jgi:PAS domain S-box-containing protein
MTDNLKNALLKPDIPPNIIEGFTERRRQAILYKTGALQSAIFNSALFSCIATDANGVIQIFNIGAERMLGYMAVEVINKVTLAYFFDSQEIIKRAETLSIEFGTPIAPGFEALVFKAAHGSEDIYELTYIRKDGSHFSAEGSVTALRDDQDVIIGYLLIGTANTARKQAEQALRQTGIRSGHLRAEEALRTSDDHYRTLFESIDEGFCIIEKVAGAAGEPLDFRYVEANPAFTTQSGISNVVGKTIRQVVPDITEDLFLTYDAVLRTGQAIRFEYELSGQSRVLELHAFRVNAETHNRVGVSFTDITERKRNQMLMVAQKKVLELAASGTAIEEILEFVVHSVQQLAGEQSRASLFLLEPDGLHLRFVVAAGGLSEGYTRAVDHFEVGPHMPSCGSAAFTGQPVIVADVTQNPLWVPFLDLAQQHEIRALWSQPLRTLDGKVLGTLAQYFTTPREPKPGELDAVQILSQTAALVIASSRAAAQHRQAEERFRAAVGIVSNIIWTNNPAGLMQGEQPGWSNFTGQPLEEYQGYGWSKMVHPEDVQPTLAAWQQAVAKKRIIKFVHRIRRRDGEWRLCSMRALPLLDDDGMIREWVGIHTDITERKQAEEALVQSEERYRNLFNSIDEGFCIIEMIFDEQDQPVDYRFLEVNPSFEKHTGMRDAKGKRMREIAPNHEAHWFEIYGGVASTGKPVRFINEAKALGGYWFDVYAAPVGKPEDRKVAILFTNITERMKAEGALRRSEERFRALFDRGPIAMYTCDNSGTIQEYNRGAVDLWGMEPQRGDTDEYFGGSLKWYLPDGTLMPYAQTPMAEILQGEISAAYDMEVVIERLDGTRIIVIANIVPLKNDEGEVTGAINCFYDITERKQIELSLKHAIVAAEKANRAKSHFLSNMSHELRTPLNAILGFTQLMQAESPPPTATQAKRLQHIAKAGWYLLELINDILDLAVIEAGRVHLAQENVVLTDILAECQAMTEAQAKKHGVQINWLPFDPCGLAHADHTRLKQVILNLLSNAIKYNRPQGSVDVMCSFSKDTIRISVKDGGEGLSADHLAQLFQPFNRLGQESGAEQGTGIGLVVTKKLVELMGGKMGVESTVGVGSEFWIELKRGTSPLGETLQLDTESMQPSAQSQPAL